MAGTMDGEPSPTSGKRKDMMDDNLAEDGQGSMKKLKRMLTQEADLKVRGLVEYRRERFRGTSLPPRRCFLLNDCGIGVAQNGVHLFSLSPLLATQ